ncbi:MAG: glycosyltransferase family 4 protein [Solirubrobacteraceae bacterium]
MTERPLRILHVVDHVRNVGNGLVNVAVDLACAQQAAGHRVAIASGGGDYEPLLAAHGVAHHRLVRHDSRIGRARLVARLGAIVASVRPEIVNAHRPYATVAAAFLRPLGRFKLIATDHNEFEAKGRYLRSADRIIAVSDGAAEALIATGIPRSQIRVVQNGPLLGARAGLTQSTGTAELHHPAIVTVAGLVERKGVHVLMQAFEAIADAHPQAHLYFVGDGPERDALERRRQAGRAGDRIHLEGFQSDPGRYLRAAEIFVLASFRDPFPLAALEARGAGAVVVASDVDGLPEAVDHGQAGLLVAPGDVEGLSRALESLLADPQELARLRERSLTGIDRFSAARMANDTDAVYREALLASTNP